MSELDDLGDMISDILDSVRGDVEDTERTHSLLRRALTRVAINSDMSASRIQALGEAADDLTDAFKSSVSKMGSAIGNLAESIGGGTVTFSSYNGTVKALTETFNEFAVLVPNVGGALSSIGEVAGETVTFMLNQMDKQYDVFEKMSTTGNLSAQAFADIGRLVNESRLPLDLIYGDIVKHSMLMAKAFGTSNEGAMKFGKTIGVLQDGRWLRNLGFTVTEVAETAAGYVQRQMLMGEYQYLSAVELARVTKNYGEELTAVSRLTGIQREQLKAQVEEQLRNSRFNAALQREDNEERRFAMQALVATVGEVDKEMAAGIMDRYAGFFTTEAAKKMAISGMEYYVKKATDNLASISDLPESLNTISRGAGKVLSDGVQQNIAMVLGDTKYFFKFSAMQAISNMKYSSDKMQQIIDEIGAGVDTSGDVDESIKYTQSMVEVRTSLEKVSSDIQSMFSENSMTVSAVNAFTDVLQGAATIIRDVFGFNDVKQEIKVDEKIAELEERLSEQKDVFRKNALLPHQINLQTQNVETTEKLIEILKQQRDINQSVIQDLKKQKQDLTQTYVGGGINSGEYNTQLEKLNNTISQLRNATVTDALDAYLDRQQSVIDRHQAAADALQKEIAALNPRGRSELGRKQSLQRKLQQTNEQLAEAIKDRDKAIGERDEYLKVLDINEQTAEKRVNAQTEAIASSNQQASDNVVEAILSTVESKTEKQVSPEPEPISGDTRALVDQNNDIDAVNAKIKEADEYIKTLFEAYYDQLAHKTEFKNTPRYQDFVTAWKEIASVKISYDQKSERDTQPLLDRLQFIMDYTEGDPDVDVTAPVQTPPPAPTPPPSPPPSQPNDSGSESNQTNQRTTSSVIGNSDDQAVLIAELRSLIDGIASSNQISIGYLASINSNMSNINRQLKITS